MADLATIHTNSVSDQQPLTNGEKYILQTIRNKKLLFLLGAYIGLVGILARVISDMWTDSSLGPQLKLSWFIKSPLVFITLLFVILTIFFLKYYFEAVHPFTKDLKSRKKDIVVFEPEKYKTPYFEEFFLKTPLKKRSLVKVNREMYDAIDDNNKACISISSFARFVFSIDIGDHKLKFDEKHFIMD